ncbi:S41 family peptidase [Petroclostridium xylanilyticum]|uniref:S41 family peptidase n=1 Tax=Petroclostridium xylanilyticum TaxID=1792311 RepID=UPI000B982FF9|nr:S41 family peptidase [Petroclostridium xylanilyticum]
MFRKRSILIGAIVLVLITIFTTFIATSVLYLVVGNLPLYGIFNVQGGRTQYTKINQVREIIKKYYVEPVEEEKLMEGAAAGVAAAVGDPYTVYMNKKEYDDFMTQTHGSYAGIGVVVAPDPKDNLITVVAPFEGTPGEKAGILPGDKIIKVNGKDVWADKLEEAVSMMKGPKNTEVTITIVRENLSQPKDITIKRDIIVLQTVKHKVIDGNIGYIRITMFDEKTSKDFDAALDDLYSKNVSGLIIDVRDNPGGLLDEVVKIADRLLPEGLIVYTEDKNKNRDTKYSDKEEIKIPLVVLVNGGSASASEILSGAIKDHGKGKLVGTKTFGKGLVQTLFPLGDGSAVKVTISKYYTPNGTSIQGVGIQPDIVVEFPEELKRSIAQIKEEEDVQLKKAIEVVKQGM